MAEGKKYQISINVNTTYLADQSDPSADRYVFAYTITIANSGTVAAQLISRHWIITDAENVTQEVKGLGVVGEQPLLRPGESFEYTSGTAMATPVGTMRGTYQMVAEDGNKFEAEIPRSPCRCHGYCIRVSGKRGAASGLSHSPLTAHRFLLTHSHFFIVHHTMNASNPAAMAASSINQPSPWVSIKRDAPLIYSTGVFDVSHLHP